MCNANIAIWLLLVCSFAFMVLNVYLFFKLHKINAEMLALNAEMFALLDSWKEN